MSEYKIIFLGDSLTAHGNWSRLFPGVNIVNYGVPGDKTRDILDRLDKLIKEDAKKLFLMCGINDIGDGRDVNDILSDYERLVERLIQRLPETKIYLLSVLPVRLQMIDNKNISLNKINTLNEKIHRMAEKKSLVYIDLHNVFICTDGNLKSELTNDGVHLTERAYHLWKDQIINFI